MTEQFLQELKNLNSKKNMNAKHPHNERQKTATNSGLARTKQRIDAFIQNI